MNGLKRWLKSVFLLPFIIRGFEVKSMFVSIRLGENVYNMNMR